ncbi:hypothetical protein TrLO_g2500 [Triparma laevis f. longispina]|uniref:Uncharacterized protein n=1 Tax=Triparma laevis f. longispina TaxID=1714387 RepID=A0A9W7C599_9STRA|nr:hypothetical protein TrLO_g2500 [Triparma laevis f. longispina]
MNYSLMLLVACMLACANAFVPASKVAAPRAFTTRTNMVPIEAIPVTEISQALQQTSTLLAQQAPTDFGGLLFPVGGIGALAALILYLSPPLAD